MVKTLPFADTQVPVPGFGAMGINFGLGHDLSLEEAEPVLLKAIELGCTFWDTAVMYKNGVNEKILGNFIKKHNLRDKVFVASKCGFDCMDGGDGRVTNSPEHIKKYLNGTIDRLSFTPDLYYLHRIDPKVPLKDSIGTLEELRQAGKTRYIGLSECSAKTLRAANAIARIDAVQAEYSPFETLHERDGLIDTAKELDIAYVAYGPLGHGWLVDEFTWEHPEDIPQHDGRRNFPRWQGESFYKNLAIAKQIKSLAAKKQCTTAQIAIAWCAAQGLIAIPGTTRPARLEENWKSREIEFTDAEMKEIRDVVDGITPAGDRYPEAMKGLVGN